MKRGTIAVTGATGNIGGAVIQDLLASGEPDVIALVRDPSRLHGPLTPATRIADYSSRADLRAALDGVTTLVFIPSDGEAARMLMHHINIVDAAVAAGVSHVLFLSMVDLAVDSPFCFAAVYRETERQLRDSGLSCTLLRAPIYAEFFAPFVVDAVKSGSLSLPTGSGVLSLISRADVAACLVSALARAPGGPYVITGDHGYDLKHLADLASRLAGTPVRAVDIGASEFCGRLLLEGVEPWWAYAFTSMFESVSQDRLAVITDTVATLLGRPPVPFPNVARRLLAVR